MIKTKSFRELIVWKKSMSLVVEIYKLTENFPKSEIYGLTSQMRRAAVAIPSNIAEGYIRKYIKEYAQFINIAFIRSRVRNSIRYIKRAWIYN